MLEFRHTGWSQKPVSHGRESSNLSMRTNIFAPLPQLVVGLDLKSECCGFESHEAYQYFVIFLCVAQSGRVLGLDPRGRRFESCRGIRGTAESCKFYPCRQYRQNSTLVQMVEQHHDTVMAVGSSPTGATKHALMRAHSRPS